MFNVFECVNEQHDRALILLAVIVSALSNFSVFFALERAREYGLRRRAQWYAMAAFAGGIGVWATHFIAMLAYKGPTPIGYDVRITSASVVVAVAFFWLALLVPLHQPNWKAWAITGVIASIGTGAMHLTGMAALIAPVRIEYDLHGLLLGLAGSSGLFILAFICFAKRNGRLKLVLSTSFAVFGVCTVHFMQMSATTLTVAPAVTVRLEAPDHTWLTVAIAIATVALAILTGIAAVIDRNLADLRGFSDASLEGLAIIQGDRIVDANKLLADMLSVESETLNGTSPDDWLLAADGKPVSELRSYSLEATPVVSPASVERIFEIATHEIEYRGRECTVLAVRDLTEKKAAQRRIEHMAHHDALTDLGNRSLLDQRIQQAISYADERAGSVALLALDLDRFKAINDLFGHSAGDDLLKKVAAILKSNIHDGDTVARVGGDEFVILQVGKTQPVGAMELAERILTDFDHVIGRARNPIAVGTSIGIALYPGNAHDGDGLKRAADVALYQAKSAGKGTYSFFENEMDQALQERRVIERDLRQAIARRQLSLVYQPLVNAEDGTVNGYEALLRWEHPDRGSIAPEVFVTIAEETGAIIEIGEWVLRQACRTAAGWPEDISIAVNISPVQFKLYDLSDKVWAILQEEGLRPDRLELEITETVLVRDQSDALRSLQQLKSLGVRIVMDDFGTGYSSLSNLHKFPIDKIKIDRSFLASIDRTDAVRPIIRAIVSIGNNLAIPVLAEGIETDQQRRIILEDGCRQAQGYFFGHPQSAGDFAVRRKQHNAA